LTYKQQLRPNQSLVVADQEPQLEPSIVLPTTIPPTPAQALPPVAQVRPWVRYWARMIDLNLFGFAFAFVTFVTFVIDTVYDSSVALDIFYHVTYIELGFASVFAWVFIEPLCLWLIGTTPGKWLFKIRIAPPPGETIKYSTALLRSFRVWWRGLAAGLPLISLLTLAIAHRNLKQKGITSWDRDGKFTVTHDNIGPLRVILGIMLILLFPAIWHFSGKGLTDIVAYQLKPISQESETQLTKIVDGINQKLPIMVDQDTRLDKVTVGPGLSIAYHYTLPNLHYPLCGKKSSARHGL